MRFLTWIYKQFLRVLPAFIFFLIAFSLINMIEGLFLKSEGIPPFSFYEVVLAAAVIAKVLILISHLPFINAFPNKPLIYNIVWKTFLYESSTFLVRIAMLLIPPILSFRSVVHGYAELIAHLDIRRFLAIQICYLLLFITFVTAEELIVSIGVKRIRKLFFGI